MKTRVYMKLAKTKRGHIMVWAGSRPNYTALRSSGYYDKKAYPTVLFALDITIPDSEFTSAARLLEVKLKEAKPAVEINEANP